MSTLSQEELCRLSGKLGGVIHNPLFCGDVVIRAVQIGKLTLPVGTRVVGGMGVLIVGEGFVPASIPYSAYRKCMKKAVPMRQEDVDQRVSICKACEHYRADSDRCGMCGCGDTVTRRCTSQYSRCPVGSW